MVLFHRELSLPEKPPMLHQLISSTLTCKSELSIIVGAVLFRKVTQQPAFADWLLSLSNTHLWFLHVFSSIAHFFLELHNILLSGWITVYLPFHLGCVQVLVIIEEDAVTTRVQVSVWT